MDGIRVQFAAGAGNDRRREARNAAGQRHRPVIALIDSGLGLLDTAHRIHQLRPDAELRLWIDSADAPWGTKDPAWIRARVLRTVEFALRDGAEIIVLPCNTASAHALVEARAATGPIPVVGTVPAIKPASARHAKFAIWATPATVGSAVQQDLIDTFASQAQAVPVASETLASAVEIGSRSRISVAIDAAVALTPDDCTAVVLGCTHYSLVSKQIRTALRPDIELYDGAQAVADRTVSLLPVQQIGSVLGSVTVFDGGIQVRSLPRSALLYEPGLAIEKLCTSTQFVESGGLSGNQLWVDAAAEVVS
ncbi:glutamate racemase [Rhodococcus sp. 5A-K4]|uniref:glutamate racemase n=1 Tax=Rhodococcus TaxID=1827 RepID=UPI00355B3CFA